MDMPQEVPAAFRTSAFRTSAVRPGPLGLVAEALDEVRSRHRLIRYLAQADLKKKGTDTLFGNVWWILDPLLQMAVYVILVTLIFQRSVPDYPLFVFAAILPWKWFTTAIGDAIASVSGQDRLIKQIKFPKIVLPSAVMLAGVAQFAFGLVPLVAMLVLMYPARISPMLVFVPLVAAVQFVFTVGLGLLLAAVNVFFRDVGILARHVLRLWFYLSPALYGAAVVAEVGDSQPIIATLMRLNPFYTILESYRQAIYGGAVPDLAALAVVLIASVGLLLVGVVFFKRLEPAFAKVL